VYPGIECDRFSFREGISASRGRKQLLMVGHVARRKDILVGVRALAILVEKGYDLELAIAGRIDDAAYKSELEEEARILGIGGRVSFLGPRRDVLELMRDAVALVHTAGSEAFGMVVIEALAIGLPVIAPNHQGPREIIEHDRSGLLAEPGDPLDFAGGLERLLSNPGYAERLAQQGRRRVEECFSAQRMAAGFEDLYVSCGP
jgi:colanic acid/amylovoran biosynthesis glycosyltransferase